MLRDKELGVQGNGIELRLGVSEGLFQLLNGKEKTCQAEQLCSQRSPVLLASDGTRRQAAGKVLCHQNVSQKPQKHTWHQSDSTSPQQFPNAPLH